jgi:hypothetical protein
MLHRSLALAALAGCLIAAGAPAETVKGLRTPDAFSDIADKQERSRALFGEMLEVIQHPRCLNCHPVDNSPRQGMNMEMHDPPVVRGAADFGAPVMRCSTCHGTANFEFQPGEGSIPGHQPWRLAPVEQGWIGLTGAEICAQLKDPDRNGGRTLAELQEHNATDGLVGWGWHPGEGREPAPGTQEIFGELTRAWIEAGAACPEG